MIACVPITSCAAPDAAASSAARFSFAFRLPASHATVAQRLEPRTQLARVLFSEDFGRCHQRRLITSVDGLRGGERRHNRLSAAYVALQQALHWVRQHEFAGYL